MDLICSGHLALATVNSPNPHALERRRHVVLYVLQLEHGCYYVGQSSGFEERVEDQFKGKGSAWTRVHRPIKVLSTRPAETKNWKLAEAIENQLTLTLMRTHGWQRVRGGFWTTVSEIDTEKNLRHHGQLGALAVSNPLEHDVPRRAAPAGIRAVQRDKPSSPLIPGRRWPPEEEAELLTRFDAGLPVARLAELHRRTERGIAARLVHLGRVPSRKAANGA